MPSSLPIIPGHRFAYDADGSYVTVGTQGTSAGPFAALDATLLNDQDDDYADLFGWRVRTYRDVTITFPELRDVTGYYARTRLPNGVSNRVFTSTDTLDGTTGTWTDQGQLIFTPGTYNNQTAPSLYPDVRAYIQPVNFPGIKGIRFRFSDLDSDYFTGSVYNLHLYGYTSPTVSVERLEFWDPTLDQQASKDALEYGVTEQGAMTTRQVRIKNLSATKTAGSIVVSSTPAPGSTGTTAYLANGITFSTDGVAFTTTLSIGDLAPGAFTSAIYVRRVVPLTEAPSIRFARVLATPTTFA